MAWSSMLNIQERQQFKETKSKQSNINKPFSGKKISRNPVNSRMIHEGILNRAKIIMNSPCFSVACFWHMPPRWLKKVGDCIQHLRCFIKHIRVSWEEFWSWLPGFFVLVSSLSGCLMFLSPCGNRILYWLKPGKISCL